ncbi:CPBP family intramembrane glutamic endopeptidase [Curtobacterium sp. ZW137]|uniref:CPBP family intramembrane glutamic endopeptidase n=1 Tax=Curtobacterium sp. ZW137 TaxID=2485104 RepID=UPI000F4B7322|nr:CPBP family intramembrane glutamic endopeptidase [Curtobacterium sp. ZW137]ROP63639.1 hypothetical protein EDF55_2399 [Curtobacterium sp. ZW137]
MRVTPKVWIGIAALIGYIVLVVVIQAASGIDYTSWGDSAHDLFFGADVSLIVAAVAVAVTVSLLGWWGPVLRERHRSPHRWTLLAPILMAVIAVVGLAFADWGAVGGAFLAAALVLLLVGFTEEVVARGILLVALRSRLSEVWVWLITSVLFGVMHMSNVFLGQAVGPTLVQVVFAFSAGSVFYVLRRTTGSLIPAMVLHAVWDFTQFVGGVGERSAVADFAQGVYVGVALLGVVCAVVVALGADERSGFRTSGRLAGHQA